MNLKNIIREIGKALIVGVAIYVVMLVLYWFNGRTITFNADFARDFAEHMAFSTIIYMANAAVFYPLMTRYRHRVFNWKILGLGVVANTVVSLIAIFVGNLLILVLPGRLTLEEFLAYQRLEFYLVSLLIALVVSAVFYAFYYYKYRQERRVKEQKIIAGTASAQFDALKNQLDPHFLFNSLNVLTSLIDEDPDQAQKFTTALSKVYRYVLEQKNKELVPVDEEFAFARTYVSLLKMRFEDSIIFDIPERSSNPEARIVPLSLQLLLENAVKHNVVTPVKPLHVRVTEENGLIVVTNNYQPKQVVRKSSGVGLHNIRQRFALLTDRQVQIRKTDEEFRVAMPVLTRQVRSATVSQEAYIADKRYQKAREKVEAIKGFYGNLAAYCIVIPFLIWMNSRTTSFPWALFPAVFWGFGLVMHGLEAHGYNPLWGKRWEERKIRELMEKDDL